jgi:hypothetical protein
MALKYVSEVPCYYVNYKHRDKNIDGFKLSAVARRKERELKGAGVEMLKKYLLGITPEHIEGILKKELLIIGVNVYYLVEWS